LALTSPTGGGRSVGIVRSRTKATEFCLFSPPLCTVHVPCMFEYVTGIIYRLQTYCQTVCGL